MVTMFQTSSTFPSPFNKLLLLIRVAPYPFGIMNVVFSQTSIPFHRYALASSIAVLKNIVHVYIGSSIRDLAEIGKEKSLLEIAVMAAGVLVAILVFLLITHQVKKALARLEAEALSEEDLSGVDDVETGLISNATTGVGVGSRTNIQFEDSSHDEESSESQTSSNEQASDKQSLLRKKGWK